MSDRRWCRASASFSQTLGTLSNSVWDENEDEIMMYAPQKDWGETR